MYSLSPTSLSLMKDCPRCFWLTLNKIWRRPSGIFPSFPNGMDRILKTHFDNFMQRGKLPPELCNNSHCEDLKLFDNLELLNIWRNNRKGLIWQNNEGNILRGAVDNVLVKNEKLIALDYKTRGYPLKEDTAAYSQQQLDIYTLLLQKNNYKTEDYAFLLFYIPKEVTETGEVIFDTELKKMNVNPENAMQVFNKAIEFLKGKCPEEKCKWCELVSQKVLV